MEGTAKSCGRGVYDWLCAQKLPKGLQAEGVFPHMKWISGLQSPFWLTFRNAATQAFGFLLPLSKDSGTSSQLPSMKTEENWLLPSDPVRLSANAMGFILDEISSTLRIIWLERSHPIRRNHSASFGTATTLIRRSKSGGEHFA